MKRTIQRIAALVAGLGLGFGALAGLEVVTHISDLNSSWPLGSDLASTSDDHVRNIKVALKTDFPNINAAVTATPANLNQLTSNTFTSSITGPAFIPNSASVPTNGIYLAGANDLAFASSSTLRFDLSTTAATLALPLTANSLNVTSSTVPSNGAYLSAANTLDFSTAGAKRIEISSTGATTFSSPSSGRFTVNALSGNFAAEFVGNSGASNSFGLLTTAGTNSSDSSFQADASSGTPYFQVRGDGVLLGRGPTAAALVDMTPDKGTFTGTLTGMTAGTTGTVNWVRMGNVVLVYIAAAISGTSNLTTMTMTGLPAAIQPATTQIGQCPVTDSASGTIVGTFSITGGTLTFGRATLNVSVIMYAQAFQNSGAKGLPAGWLISYSLL